MLRLLFGGNSGDGNNGRKPDVTMEELGEIRASKAMLPTGGRNNNYRFYYAYVKNSPYKGIADAYYFDSPRIMSLWVGERSRTLYMNNKIEIEGVFPLDHERFDLARRTCIRAIDFLSMSDDQIRQVFNAKRVL